MPQALPSSLEDKGKQRAARGYHYPRQFWMALQ
jgi:hypothetical protein